MENLSEEKIKQKIDKFSRGREEREGKIIKESYFAKQLDDDIYYKAIKHAGGYLLWTVISLSYMITYLSSQSRDYYINNLKSNCKVKDCHSGIVAKHSDIWLFL